MPANTFIEKLKNFFLVKIILATVVIIAAVAFSEFFIGQPLGLLGWSESAKSLLVACADAGLALLCYVLLFRGLEKRKIDELNPKIFGKNALAGFLTGLFLQSLFILVVFLSGGYQVHAVNPLSSMIHSFATALTAGFVGELVIRGVFFRLIEEKAGTYLTLILVTAFFTIIHMRSKGATSISGITSGIEAGFTFSAVFVFSRNLWMPIFLHMAWDFAEPGIFGAINPGNTISESLLTSELKGPVLLTGGAMGPQNSIQALIICFVVALFFLWMAGKKGRIRKAPWKNQVPEGSAG